MNVIEAQEMPAWLPRFTVGDRVLIRMSLECPCTYAHPLSFDGQTGTITEDFEAFIAELKECPPDLIRDYIDTGHRWTVDVDGPPYITETGRWIGRASFAAQELELLTSESPPRDA